MDKSLWPDLESAKLPVIKKRVPVEKSSPSFAGALKKQTSSSASDSVSTATVESKDVKETLPKNNDDIPRPDFEERKQAKILRRKAIKQEKRLLREEDVRRQIVAPKGYVLNWKIAQTKR